MQAYICLTDDNRWAVATRDGAQEIILAVGRPFQPGAGIRDALAELEAWARENGCDLTTAHYAIGSWSLRDLIEPEIFDAVFSAQEPL